MNPPERNENGGAAECSDVAPLLPFYACDELDPQEREMLESHLVQCAGCTSQLEQERRLLDAIDSLLQPADKLNPSDILLSQCRSELSERLDDLAAPPAPERWRPFGWVRPWMGLRPAWSATFLLAIGIAVGTQAPNWLRGGNDARSAASALKIRAMPSLTEDQLSHMAIAGIAPGPDAASDTVQVQLRAEQPLVISGSPDDSDVRRVLTYILENGKQFDPGVRLDCLDALKLHTRESDVEQAVLAAARRDPNAAVRLKALEALRDSTENPAVRDALIDVLDHDTNPGVRVEAVNLLVGSLKRGDDRTAPELAAPPPSPVTATPPLPPDPSVERVVRALEEMTRKDPNRNVRLRSAAALRQIGPREQQ